MFNPQFDLIEISYIDNFALVTISVSSNRFEFLENNPIITKQKLTFVGKKIVQIENMDYVDVNWIVWQDKKDRLVKWIDEYHPDLSGFINDMTKKGAENYMKAIELYNDSNKNTL